METSQHWYQKSNIPFASPAYSHPDWAGASPTADMDVYWFYIKPQEGWTVYQFDYEGLQVSLRYLVKDDITQLEFFFPGEDKSLYESQTDIIEEFRCSVWLGETLTEQERLTQAPTQVFKYNVFEDFMQSFSVKTSEKMVFGFYTAEWY